jgi:hypothetical protein
MAVSDGKFMIKADFKNDWREFLQGDMPVFGLKYDSTGTLEDNNITYLNAKRRTVPPRKRAVHESKELQIPPKHATDYAELKKLISEGGDLTPYLSHDIRKSRADKNDAMLNNLGFHHLHFSPRGDRDVLIVKITETDVFLLKALPHGQGYPETWVDTDSLRILHENWPDASVGKVFGIHGESFTPTQRINLSSKNVNFATTMPDGTVFLAPGGGVSGSGRCSLDVRDSDVIFAQLAYWQRVVEENEANLRSALNVLCGEVLWIRMKFDNGEWRLYEVNGNREIRLIIKSQQPTDARAKSDIAGECLDSAIQRALDDEKNNRVRPL